MIRRVKRFVAGVLAVVVVTASCSSGSSNSSRKNPVTGSPHAKSSAPINADIQKSNIGSATATQLNVGNYARYKAMIGGVSEVISIVAD